MPAIDRQTIRKLKPPTALWRGSSLLAFQLLNWWFSTLHFRVYRYDPTADPADPSFEGPSIYALWHEYLPIPLYIRPRSNMAMLVSHHQDAEILSQLATWAGMQVVRGSSTRGGVSALRSIMMDGRRLSLAITPDGPRGPRRILAQGCIYLSSRLQIPIIPVGVGYQSPWRNRSAWDNFAIPKPFSRSRIVLGPKLLVPPNQDRQGIELHRKWIEQQLNCLTTFAEDWANHNWKVPGSEIIYPSPPVVRNRFTQDHRSNPIADSQPDSLAGLISANSKQGNSSPPHLEVHHASSSRVRSPRELPREPTFN